MNITSSTIYWITRLDCINTILIVTIILSLVAFLFFCVGCIASTSDYRRSGSDIDKAGVRFFKCMTKRLLCVLIFVATALALVPTTKELAAIVIIPKIANSEIVGELGELGKDLVGLAKEWMLELKPNKDKEVK